MPNPPTQARSRARLEHILATAAAEIVQHGAGGFSMNGVAQRAGISPGSLYQYFADRNALMDALQKRHLTEIEARMREAAAALAARSELDVATVVRAFLRPAAAFYRANPAYAELHHARNRPYAPELQEDQLDTIVLNLLAEALGRVRPGAPAGQQRIAEIMLEAAHALLVSISARADADADARLGELEIMLQAYAGARLDSDRRG